MSEFPQESGRFFFRDQNPRQFLDLSSTATKPCKSDGGGGCYWKCGVLTPDAAHLAKHLTSKGYSCGAPHQFQDIGVLGHVQDESKMTTEILQHTFEKNFIPLVPREEALNRNTLGQLTIRTNDIGATLRFWTEALGWKVLSHQKLEKFGFALYFLASPTDVDEHWKYAVDDAGLEAVNIREALWSAPFCTLEIQYKFGPGDFDKFAQPSADTAGFLGMVLGTNDVHALTGRVAQVCGGEVVDQKVLYDPNGIPLYLETEAKL